MATTTKTGIFKQSTAPTATFGTSSSANTALQNAINAVSPTQISVDSKYGPQTQNAFNALTSQGYTYANGAFTKPTTVTSTSDPVISSTGTRNGYDALGNEITTKINTNNETYTVDNLKSASEANQKLIEDRLKSLESNYNANVGGIKTAYEEANRIQEGRQAKDYAGRATSLVTAGGGFLGATQSQQGVLQNLTETFTNEKNALMAKRDAALQAAADSYGEKNFALAQMQLKEAKDTEQEIYNRQQDFASQQLDLAKENRSQTEFEYGITDKRAESYATLTDEEYKTITPEQKKDIDTRYYPGYLDNLQEVKSKETEMKTSKDALDLETTILDMRLKMPSGKKFQLNGVTYTGMKTETQSFTQADKEIMNKQKVQSWFTSATTIPGTDSVPFLDSTGFATPEGWQTAYDYSGLDRRKFIQEFSYLLRQSGVDDEKNPKYDNYGLTPSEMKLVNTQIPVNY